MKRKTLTLIISFFFGIQLIVAQAVIQGTGPSGGDSEITFGAKAGLNVSTFLGKDFVDISPRPGAYFGGLAEIPFFVEDLYLQPEALISFQGADIGPENLNLVYLHIPLMGKYHITDEIAAEFGPQISILVGDNTDKIDPNNTLDPNTLQIGLNVGGGYRLDDNLYFQLRLSFGLSQVLDNTEISNGVLSIGGCYFF